MQTTPRLRQKGQWMKSTNTGRPEWESYFLDLTYTVAKRSTCLRRNIGAIAVIDKRILATGYNGPPAGIQHCADRGGCIRQIENIPSGEQQEKCYAIHAEENVIIQGAMYGVKLAGANLYCTNQPCIMCIRKIINCGFSTLTYTSAYPDEMTVSLLKECGSLLVRDIDNYKNVHIWTLNR